MINENKQFFSKQHNVKIGLYKKIIDVLQSLASVKPDSTFLSILRLYTRIITFN